MQHHSVTSLETARSMANGPSWGGGGAEGEVCILHSPGIAASPVSLYSMEGVCGWSLTAGEILFTGRQTCSLYLVLWLCGSQRRAHFICAFMSCDKSLSQVAFCDKIPLSLVTRSEWVQKWDGMQKRHVVFSVYDICNSIRGPTTFSQ